MPFFPDRGDQCGPAALASVLGYWGRGVEPARLRREVYRPGLRGALTVDLLLAARAHGLCAEMSSGSLSRVKAELDAGRPVIAFVNLGPRFLPLGHYLVLTGYDDGRGGVYAHSGAERDAFLSYRGFLRRWDRTGRWSLLVSSVAP